MSDRLEEMNYRDLQKLAKAVGVKANLPKAELLRALQDHQQESVSAESAGAASVLNTTFEVDSETVDCDIGEEPAADGANLDISDDMNANDSLLTNDGVEEEHHQEKSHLNGTFNMVGKDDTATNSRRQSTRLSVGGLTVAALVKETVSSPALKKSSPGSSTQQIHNRRIIAASTPKGSTGKKATVISVTRLKTTSATPRAVFGSAVKQGAAVASPRMGALGSAAKRSAAVAAVVERLTTPAKRKLPEETASNIPRFVKFSKKAPDFAKLHERQFEQMESLDSYIAKKRQRTQAAQEELQKMETLFEEHSKIVERCKTGATPGGGFVPAVTTVSKMNLNFGGGNVGSSTQPFRFAANAAKAPSSIKKKDERPKTNLKTLTRNKGNSTPKRTAQQVSHKSSAKATAAVARTPAAADKVLLNITNKSLVGGGTPSSAAKKPVFDLKASLAKPLGYKPHAGKLQDWGKKKVTEQRQISTREVIEKTRDILKGVRMNKRAALLLQNRKMN